jgi:dodecin
VAHELSHLSARLIGAPARVEAQVKRNGRRPVRLAQQRRRALSDHIYKIIEVVGSSPTSIEDAIEGAINRAAATVDDIGWFEVASTRGHVEGGKLAHYQVTLRIGFTLRDTKRD